MGPAAALAAQQAQPAPGLNAPALNAIVGLGFAAEGMHTGMVRVFADLDAVSRAAAEHWVASAEAAQSARGAFHVALAGGGTPRRLYQCLARPEFRERVNWAGVHVWFGDERAVPPAHADSNYRMAREALLDRVPLPAAQVHRIEAEHSPIAEAALRYAEDLATQAPHDEGGRPTLDLVLLGLGEDGHTASLFPGTDILHERRRLVAAVHVPRLDAWRISLTYAALDSAREALFLVAGAGKADIVHRLFADPPPEPLPAQRVRPREGTLWYLDEAAAARLPEELRGAPARR